MATSTLKLNRGRALAGLRVPPLAIAVLVALVAATGVVLAHRDARLAGEDLVAQQTLLAAALHRAAVQGYTAEDLAPVASTYQASFVSAPVLDYFSGAGARDQARLVGAALDRVPAQLAAALDRHRSRASAVAGGLRTLITQADGAGADSAELQDARALADGAAAAVSAAATPPAVDAVGGRLSAASASLVALVAEIHDDQRKVDEAATALQAQPGVDIVKVRASATGSLATARNDATAARFMGIAEVAPLIGRLEHYATLAADPDPGAAFQGAAGIGIFHDRIHDVLMKKMPAKAIVVSIGAQELWAYEGGKLVQDTLVTTGRPPLDTDIGPMQVLKKDAPWKMHSPWPRSSPHWYPDATVKQVLWFTNTGEGLHDAYWQPDGTYGPGSQNTSVGSHGCIHVPVPVENFLFSWADVGTPVVVIPGDGTPVTAQLAKRSVDDTGQPLSGAKGA